MKTIRILCISGSLRKASYNTALIGALRELAPKEIDVAVFEGMEQLLLFNPDREEENLPAVKHLKDEVKRADGLIIASPEYAHGISGVLKNNHFFILAIILVTVAIVTNCSTVKALSIVRGGGPIENPERPAKIP